MMVRIRRLAWGAILLLTLAACGSTATPSGTEQGTTSPAATQPAAEPALAGETATATGDEVPYVAPPTPTVEVTAYPAPAP